MRWFFACAFFLLSSAFAFAVEPDEMLFDSELEARARALSAQIRCVVCQNEPIDNSNAELARDIRLLVRERLVAGDSDQDIYDYLRARYGDFILFAPPFDRRTLILWFGPFFLAALGILGVLARRHRAQSASLSEDEERRLSEMLSKVERE